MNGSTNETKQESASRLRWLIDSRWGDTEIISEAQRLIDIIVGYPAPSRGGVAEPKKLALPKAPSRGEPGRTYKVALAIGHNERSKGAAFQFGKFKGQFERDWNTEVANRMIAMAPKHLDLKIFMRTYGDGYSAETGRQAASVNRWGPDFAYELHFNAYTGKQTYGFNIVAVGASEASKKIATLSQVRARTVLKTDPHEIEIRNRSQNGVGFLRQCKSPCTLLEPFFGDNEQHCLTVSKLGVDGYASMLLAAIEDCLSVV